jgi:hypothetical protein
MGQIDYTTAIRNRLEYLRGQLRAEYISMDELIELQELAEHIDPGDAELLEAAGVPERRLGRAPNDLEGMPVETAADYLTGLTQDGCTGYLTALSERHPGGESHIYIHHDGDTCPVHETGAPT